MTKRSKRPKSGETSIVTDQLHNTPDAASEDADWYTTIPISSWSELQSEYEKRFALRGRQWVFRGHQLKKWDLKPSLERVVRDRFNLPQDKIGWIEEYLLRHFQRHLHRLQTPVPDEADTLQWLALMQHHGAPTRLLDWTYSCYIALFFALESALLDSTCAVWAIDQVWLFRKLQQRKAAAAAFRIDRELRLPSAAKAILECKTRSVAPLVPFYVNERLAVQQGVFLVPLDLTATFMDNLQGVAASEELQQHVLKLEIPVIQKVQYQMLMSLDRLNVNRLSLFPGLDGFAQSLQLSPLWWHPDSYRE